MTSFLSRFRLGYQISFIGAIGGLGLLLVAATWFVGSGIEAKVTAVMESATSSNELLDKIEVTLLQARRHEKDFLMRRRDEYLERHTKDIKVAGQKIAELTAITTDAEHLDLLRKLKEDVGRYAEQFGIVAELQKKIGQTEDDGLLGALRSSVHHAELVLATTNHDRLTILMLQMRRHEKDFLARQDAKYVDKFNKEMASFLAALPASELVPDVQKQLADEMSAYGRDFQMAAEASLRQVAELKKLSETFTPIEPLFATLTKHITEDYAEAKADAVHDHDRVAEFMVAIIVVSFVLGALGTVVISRGIYLPLGAAIAVMLKLARGEHDVEIPGRGRRDEIGDMAEALQTFKEMEIEQERQDHMKRAEDEAKLARMERLNRLTANFEGKVGSVVSALSGVANDMQMESVALNSTAEQTNRQSMAVAAAAEQASANVQTVASAAEELTASISEISRQVVQSTRASQDAVGGASRATTVISGLAEAAQRIGEVVNLINDIASQTNLLALNATIEAARAGEAGKGFAVVASEVKALANQTSKATEDIAQQVTAIQNATEHAVEAVSEVGRFIGEVSEISSSIAAAVEEQGAATKEISRNVQEAANGTQEVSVNITGVTQAAAETGNAARQVNAVAGIVTQRLNDLRAEVDGFLAGVKTA